MQNVLIEKPYEFIPPFRNAWMQRWLLRLNVHRRILRKRDGVVAHEIRHLERIQASRAAGHGILLIPNHPRTADPAAICHLAKAAPFPFFTMASWHLFHQKWWMGMALRASGAFSVHREGLDKRSVDFAIDALQRSERVLVVFPEGTTSRTNDRLMAFMEGPSFIARAAARRREKRDGGQVVVHPIAIKYLFQGNLDRVCNEALSDIEHRLTWRPQNDMPLIPRVIKVGNAMLALKELQYDARVDESLSLRARQTAMVNHLLNPLEAEWLGAAQQGGVQIRVKNLRMKIFPDLSRAVLEPQERERRWRQLQDTYLAQQIDCYPEDYVVELPTVDRILETVEKFEEDLTDEARRHGDLKVVLDVGEAIPVATRRERGLAEDPLTTEVRKQLQATLEALQLESNRYAPSAADGQGG